MINVAIAKISNHVQQNREHTHIRDGLLPLLVNGQVRVAGDAS